MNRPGRGGMGPIGRASTTPLATILSDNTSGSQIRGSYNNSPAVGLVNLGNTCFMNAVLQSLASIRAFHSYLASQSSGKENSLTETMKETISALAMKNRTIEPSVIRVGSLRTRFLTNEQQDAHELMQFIITVLTEEMDALPSNFGLRSLQTVASERPSPLTFSPITTASLQVDFGRILLPGFGSQMQEPNPSAVGKQLWSRNPFVGILQSTLRCKECGRKFSPTYQKFVDLSLSIPDYILHSPYKVSCTLEKCLEFFFQSEIVKDVNCECCKSRNKHIVPPQKPIKVDAMKKLSIARPPKTLCLHIRRLIGLGGPAIKLNCLIDFPLELDLSPFCSFNGEVIFDSMLLKSVMGTDKKVQQKTAPKCSSVRLVNEANPTSQTTSHHACVGGKGDFNPKKQNEEDISCDCTSKKTRVEKKNDSDKPSMLYRLASVVVHHGNHSGGHYTVFRKLLTKPFTNKQQYDEYVKKLSEDPNFKEAEKREWVHISDENVQRVDVDDVMRSQAYMLYYEKVE